MPEVKVFLIEGEMRMGLFKQRFSKTIKALKPEHAVEKLYSLLGSNHKLKRDQITIKRIVELEEEAVVGEAK
ncbi:MAG: 50S ribosomal protein LX [Candidatus Methanomethylicota archaeon]|uniref:Large ribosomal subunit protein eL20 n=1 Tax=Thermoproteota archaeon TaxID=2056631 RepID=A0A497EZL3_9CREN|nr:MAG: 50S ribosomal protein LX [Candidatus Verstraetearchaeota archaeon]RLE52636.1 MAG: 50S ribosomal protein LX [Candidatus Verstraetearchaeota archaeon]